MSVFTSLQANPEGSLTKDIRDNQQLLVRSKSSGLHDPHEICGNSPTEHVSPHLIPLKSVIGEEHSNDKVKWITGVVESAKRRFGRIPRGGWRLIAECFNVRFLTQKSVSDVKNLLNVKPCSNGCGSRNNVDTSDYLLPKTEISIYGKCKEEFNLQIQELKSIPRNARMPTKKIPYKLLKTDVLVAINAVISNYILSSPPASINEITDIIYAGQCSYENITRQPLTKSTWLEDTERKISKLRENLTFVNKFNGQQSKDEKEKTLNILCSFGYKKSRKGELARVSSLIEDRVKIMEKKISTYRSRKSFRQDNFCFELNRRRFYRRLNCENKDSDCQVPEDKCLSFWKGVWKKEENRAPKAIVGKHITGAEQLPSDVKTDFIKNVIQCVPNWKAAGCDGVYGFFIKKFEALHGHLCDEILKIVNGGYSPAEWFYTGVTYLIPKNEKCHSPNDLRPITCMPILYKLVTKCVNTKLTDYIEAFNLISDNQLGARRQCQGAKEQALINQCVNSEYGNNLFATWIDVRKAFDSVNHEFLCQVLDQSGIPNWITNFVKTLIKNWNVILTLNNKRIGTVKLERGILQGDSLSPQLFTLVMDPLSRSLNMKFPKVRIGQNDPFTVSYSTNHLLFIDDLKIIAEKEDTVLKMMEDVDEYFDAVGLKRNSEKSATNLDYVKDTKCLDGCAGYRYLGVLEDRGSDVKKIEVMKTIARNVKERIESLAKTKLSAVNLFKAINEYALSLYNYYIGLIDIEPSEFDAIDLVIRRILTTLRIHLKPANKERLYLGRNGFGRGLISISNKSECILLQFLSDLERKASLCLRRAGILRVLREKKTHMTTIARFLALKYNLEDQSKLDVNLIKECQKKRLMDTIKSKMIHSTLFKCIQEPSADIVESNVWLANGNNGPKAEALYCLAQDRNLFFGEAKPNCNHCGSARKTVDHLATRCSRMLHGSYMRRHNEIVRCIHLHVCRQYGIKKCKKLKAHSVQSVVENSRVEIRVDMTLQTDIEVKNNKPDIFVLDKMKNEITIIEVGVTSQDRLKQVEVEKLHKYDLLAGELAQIHKAKVTIVPVVLTWDGVVTKFYKSYMKKLNIEVPTKAYIQSVTIKKTLESMVVEYKHGMKVDNYQIEKETDSLIARGEELGVSVDLPEESAFLLQYEEERCQDMTGQRSSSPKRRENIN
ncbi:uncharacterized protein LOC115228605 [Octopus sinensis]|uniref:Uncharacterized protein LOC115228605 n=1 Tax=Octopus sinensis TaxID=2607531 RepID=A0A6P7U0F8_9MOLL|nr:uncharacterized protein LOC115228605 [Octopus sinensis]